MRLALQDAGHHEGEVVALFLSRAEKTDWCRGPSSARNLRETAAAFETLWQERDVAQSSGSVEALQREMAGWTRGLAASDRDASLADMSRLARRLARACSPRFWARTRRRQHASSWIDAIQAAARHPSQYLEQQQVASSTHVEGQEPEPANRRGAVLANAGMQMEIASPVQWRVFPSDAANRWTEGELAVRLVRKTPETHDVMTFEFAPLIVTELVYQPGQSVAIQLRIDGEETRRSYTISSSPSRKDRLWITVKRVEGGKVSNWLMDNAEPGFEMKLRGPHGKFSWAREKPKKVLFLSAGSGITPMLSMTRYCADLYPDTDIVFWHAARTREDLICRDELALYERRLDAFRVVYALSREPEQSDWTGIRGRCKTENLFSSVPDLLERTVFLCGPAQFRDQVRNSLDELGFDAGRFYAESFGGKSAKRITTKIQARKWQRQNLTELLPAPSRMRDVLTAGLPTIDADSVALEEQSPAETAISRQAPTESAGIRVRGHDGPPVAIDKSRSVLELLESARVSVESSCRMGVCGACKARCLSGTVEFENAGGLTEEEEKQGWILSCTSYAESELELEV